jgi:DNA-binding SARP family transcriptional activator/tetratricopeptide (TPR) repeat protein
MAQRTDFCLLGPLQVRSGGVVVPVRRGKQRAVLAALLLSGGKVVSLDELAEILWGPQPPPSARVTIQNYVMRLRQALGDTRGSRISTQPRGYLIRMDPGELDVARFEALLGAAREAARGSSWDTAAVQSRAALLLWQGEPLSDVESEVLAAREVPRLVELRLQALEVRIDADLHLGRQAEVIAELRRLVTGHPLREHLHGLLMLALWRDGRQAEALAAYQDARRVLVEELGTQPGPVLQELHQRMLAGDPALVVPAAARPAAGAAVPRELPAGVAHFTGRTSELAALSRLLDASGFQMPGTVVISAIGGTAGVGKTALAVHWAHQVAGQFPDGQLYVNLRGYDPAEPMSAADALAGFLRTLGVQGQEIPDEIEDRARLYRSRLAGRRLLVLLDNARNGEQVRPLLPGDPGCVAVVTSRDALAGLVATDGARRLDVDVLPLADAVLLLRALIGVRADYDPAATAELAALCARLPLALRIAAELAATRRTAPLAELATELAASRLDTLDAGEDRADVRAVFSWSVRQLPGDAAGAFALTGLHPGSDLDAHAAAALAGTSTGQARRVLGQLHRASLIQAAGPGRYGMHDLLRAYARDQAAARYTGEQRDQILTRLFDYYLAAAAAAMDVLFPAEAHLRPRIAATAAVVPVMPGEADARAWLDAERANLVAAVVHCAGYGWPRHAAALAATLFRDLMGGSHLPEARTIYGHMLQAARRSGDLAAEAEALNGLGGIGIMTGHFRDAAGHYQAALERYRRCGDGPGEARALHNIGITENQMHNHQSAAGYYRQAIAAYHDAGDDISAARALASLAAAETQMGSYDQASLHLRQALPALRDARHQFGEAQTLQAIGELNLRRGQLGEAAVSFEQALAIFRRIGDRVGVADQLCNLGEVCLRQGEYRQARGYLQQALAQCRETGDQFGEIVTLRNLAEALHKAGQPAAARTELAAALRLAAETGNTYEQASAHRDLAESHHHAGDDEQAHHHWQQALTLYTQLGAPEADQVQSRLITQETKEQH